MIARVLRAVQRWILRSVCDAGYEMVGQEMPLPPDPGTRDAEVWGQVAGFLRRHSFSEEEIAAIHGQFLRGRAEHRQALHSLPYRREMTEEARDLACYAALHAVLNDRRDDTALRQVVVYALMTLAALRNLPD